LIDLANANSYLQVENEPRHAARVRRRFSSVVTFTGAMTCEGFLPGKFYWTS